MLRVDNEVRREVNDITFRLRHALVAASLAGLLLGSAAAAWGQSDGSSSSNGSSSSSQTDPGSSGSTPAPAPGRHPHDHNSANCPNMGGSSGSDSSTPSSYSGI